MRLTSTKHRRLSFGYEYESRPTRGTEFDSHRNRFHMAVQQPVGTEPGWLLDVRVQYLAAGYGKTLFDRDRERRDDDESRLSLAFRRRFNAGDEEWMPGLFEQLELSLGAVASFHRSNVPVYDYDRYYIFIGVKAGLRGANWSGVPEGAGTSTAPIVGDPGSDRPVVPSGLPDASADTAP